MIVKAAFKKEKPKPTCESVKLEIAADCTLDCRGLDKPRTLAALAANSLRLRLRTDKHVPVIPDSFFAQEILKGTVFFGEHFQAVLNIYWPDGATEIDLTQYNRANIELLTEAAKTSMINWARVAKLFVPLKGQAKQKDSK